MLGEIRSHTGQLAQSSSGSSVTKIDVSCMKRLGAMTGPQAAKASALSELWVTDNITKYLPNS